MYVIIYIIVGVVIGATVGYVAMSRKVNGKQLEIVKLETQMELYSRQRAEEQQQHEHQLAEQQQTLQEQFDRQQQSQREQFDEQLRTTKEQLVNMSRQLVDLQAQRMKAENQESMGTITQPLKDAIAEMRKAISDNTKDHTAQTASLKEQLRLMMETGREMSQKAEGLANVLRRDNKVSGNMGEIILGDLLASQGLTEGLHYEVQARLPAEE